MSKPFKFRYVNEIVGAFVLLVVAAVVIAIFLAGREQGWFLPDYDLTTVLPEDGSEGLQEGAEVSILGTRVGTVYRIAPREDGNMVATLRIRGDYFDQYVRKDSSALLKKKIAGLGGDTIVEIKRGKGAKIPYEGATIETTKDTELMDKILGQVDEVKAEVLETLRKAQGALQEFAAIGQELRSPEGHMQHILGNLNRIAQELTDGEGAAGAILRDPQMAVEVRGIVQNIRAILDEVQKSAAHIPAIMSGVDQTMEKLPGIAENVDYTTSLLPDIARSVNATVQRVPGIVAKVDDQTDDLFLLLNQARRTLQESEKTLEGLQRHWLLRSAMEKATKKDSSPNAPLLTPEEMQKLEGR